MSDPTDVKAKDIATLVELFEASKWDELHVEIDGLQLFLSTDPEARLIGGTTTGWQQSQPAETIPPVSATPATGAAPQSAPQARPATETGAGDVPDHWVAVKAPNLGTFYRAPKPGAEPYVAIGQKVDESTEVCLLEVMKLFTAVAAGISGTVRQICVEDAEMVEFDQPLLYIEPA